MEKYKWSTYLWKLLWVFGLVLLSSIIVHFENQVRYIVNATFNFSLLIWSNLIFSIIFGIYISLIFVKKWYFANKISFKSVHVNLAAFFNLFLISYFQILLILYLTLFILLYMKSFIIFLD